MELIGLLAIFLAALLPFVLLILLITAHQHGDGRSDPQLADWTGWVSSKTQPDWTRKQIEASFRRKVMAASLPAVVVSLAEAYADGADCGFALHDALLEAGRPELAEPFRTAGAMHQLAVVEQILDRG